MKLKLISLALAATALLCACGGENQTEAPSSSPAPSQSDTSESSQSSTQPSQSSTEPDTPKASYTLKKEQETFGFENLQAAFNKAKTLIQESSAKLDLELKVSEGEHFLSSEASFGSDLEGKDYSLSIHSEGGVLTSAVSVSIDDLEDEGLGQYSFILPNSAKKGGKYLPLHDLMLNGKALPMARSDYYNVAVEPMKYSDSETNASGTTLVPADRHVFYCDAALFTNGSGKLIDSSRFVGAELWVKNVWKLSALRIEGYDANDFKTSEEGRVLYAVKVNDDDWMDLFNRAGASLNFSKTLMGNCYYITNAAPYLSENTFVYDRANGKFTIQVAEDADPEQLSFSYPVASRLLNLSGAKNVSVKGLGFTGTTNEWVMDHGYITQQAGAVASLSGDPWRGFLPYAGVYGENVSDILIENCHFYELGADGIQFKGAVDNVTIRKNRIKNMASCGIRLSQCAGNNSCMAYSADTHYRNILIEENNIDHVGTVYHNAIGIQVGRSRDVKILHNTLHHTTYSAISMGWAWRSATNEQINIYHAEIAYNYIDGFMCGMQDGAAIYVMGGNAERDWKAYFNTMHDNFAVVCDETGKISGVDDYKYNVYYLDAGSSNWDVYNNVAYARHESNPPRYNYIYFQYIDNQESWNCRAIHNYICNLADEGEILGGRKTGLDAWDLVFEDNHAVPDYETLVSQYPQALEIIQASGDATDHGVYPEAKQ